MRAATRCLLLKRSTLSHSLSLQELDKCCPPGLEPTQQVMTATGPASPRYVEDAVDIIRKVHRTQGPGHVLAFFTGQDEIERASRLLSEAVAQEKIDRRAMGIEEEADNGVSEMIVVPLFGALSAEAQADAFKSARAGVRKVRTLTVCFFAIAGRDKGKVVASVSFLATSVNVDLLWSLVLRLVLVVIFWQTIGSCRWIL